MTDFEEYVERYSIMHRITPEEALKHKLVQEVKDMYMKDGRDDGHENIEIHS